MGTVVRLPERLLDPVTGLSGSGPAYFFLVAEALIESGVQMGLTRDVSRTLVVETMLGSATLLAETGEEPAVLRAMVTSPGGHHGGRGQGPRVASRALGLHGGGGGGHGAVALAASLSHVDATVFFLSDYGTEDEFVGRGPRRPGRRPSPGLTVIDLTHQIPAFDVRAGSHTLVRASPHLGPGVVLAVVDPGVGSAAARPVHAGDACCGDGPAFFVGPDNGLLIAAAEQVGEAPIARAFELRRPGEVAGRGRTFDGRDLFAPAAAALCGGVAPEELGDPIDPLSLVRLPGGVVEQGRRSDGRSLHAGRGPLDRPLRQHRSWRRPPPTPKWPRCPAPGAVTVAIDLAGSAPGHDRSPGRDLRRSRARASSASSSIRNGHLAVVAGEASAAAMRTRRGGRQMVVLTW